MELQWPLIIFTTLIAWSVGTFGSQGILAMGGKAKRSQNIALICSFVLLAVAGISVFFHLQHWERIFNGFGHITSGITQELIAIVVFFVVEVVYFAKLRQSGDGTVPKWCALLAVLVSIVLTAVCAHSYMMPARPAWDSVLEVLSIIGSACLLGPLTMAMFMSHFDGSADECAIDALVGAVIALVCSVGYGMFLLSSAGSYASVGNYIDPTQPTAGMLDVFTAVSEQAPLIWLGAVVVGSVLPLFATAYAWKKGGQIWKVIAPIAIILALVGAVCMRIAFYETGFSVFLFY